MQRNIVAQRRIKLAAYFLIGFIVAAGTVFAINRVNAAPMPELPTPGHLEPAKSIPLTIEVRGEETYAQAEARTKREIRALRENRKGGEIPEKLENQRRMTLKVVHPAVPARTSSEPQGNIEKRIRELAAAANFPYTDYLVRLAYCESTFNPKAVGKNIDKKTGKVLSTDYGVFQFNDRWHPEVMHIAFDLDEATKWTMWRIENGYQHEWACDKIIRKR